MKHSNDKKVDKISTFGLIMVVVGACIGSGIFLTPQSIAAFVGQEFLIMLAWVIGGIIVLTGALCYSELSGLFPGAGGVYVYLKEAFGKRMAFLYGWSVLTVITSGSIAAITLACATYTNQLLGNPMNSMAVILLAAGFIVFNTFIHTLGIKIGEVFNNVLTGLKIIGLLALIAIGVFFANSIDIVDSNSLEPIYSSPLTAIGMAMIPILWSFGGFQHATFLAADAINPKKSVPIGMLAGVSLVTIIYLLVNYAYISTLGLSGLMQSEKPALDTVFAVFGNAGNIFVNSLIILSTFGSAFLFTMSAPRIYFAMAKDDVFFSWMAKKHKKYNTPANAIISQSVWSIVLLLFWGTFEALINYVTFLEWIFLGAAGIAVVKFRSFLKVKTYVFKMPLYPILPFIFGISVLGFLLVTLANGNEPAIYGTFFIFFGLVAYEVFKRLNRHK